MTSTRCENCGKVYRTTGEIIQAGGSCRNVGLSLRAWCVCGFSLGGVNKLWRKTMELKFEQVELLTTEAAQPAPELLTLTSV